MPKRKPIPTKVRLEACLLLLGFAPGEELDWDHFPALELRPVLPDDSDWDPPQHDPRYIQPLRRADHKVKTNGRKGESRLSISPDGDKQRIAKVKRIRDQKLRDEMMAIMEEPSMAAIIEKTETRIKEMRENPKFPKPSRWPKGRKMQSRPFAKKEKSK